VIEYLSGCEFITKRSNSTQRTAGVAEAEDITELLNILDNLNVLSMVQFGALLYSRLPKYGPEDLNICAIAEKQVSTDNSIAVLSAKVEALASDTQRNKQAAEESIHNKLQDQLMQLNAMCAQLASACSSVPSSAFANTLHESAVRAHPVKS